MGNRVYVQRPVGRGDDAAGADHRARRRHRQGRLGLQDQPVPERRAVAPHRLGLARGRSGDGQHLRAERRRAGHRAEPRRQAAVEPLVRRGVRRLHDARRPDDVAARRRRPGHRQRRGLELGPARGARPSPHRARQAHRRRRLRRQSRAPGRTTPPTPRRSSPPSTGSACSSSASATAPSTPSSRRPARRSGATSPPSARSTPASRSRTTACSSRTATRT